MCLVVMHVFDSGWRVHEGGVFWQLSMCLVVVMCLVLSIPSTELVMFKQH